MELELPWLQHLCFIARAAVLYAKAVGFQFQPNGVEVIEGIALRINDDASNFRKAPFGEAGILDRAADVVELI